MARGKAKTDHRADTRGGGWTGLPHVVQDSVAYRDLSLWARAVLLEIVREFNGYNNGEIVLSVSQICERLGNTNRGKAGRAIAELMEHGFIDVEADAKWKQRLAREYRLTFVTSGKFPALRPASNDYQRWGSEKIRGNDALPETPLTGNASLPEAERAGNAPLPDRFAALRKTADFAQEGVGVAGNDASLLIDKPYHAPNEGGESAPFDTPNSERPKSGAAILRFPDAGKPGCEHCQQPIPLSRSPGPNVKRFCSERCRKTAETLRAKARKQAAQA